MAPRKHFRYSGGFASIIIPVVSSSTGPENVSSPNLRRPQLRPPVLKLLRVLVVDDEYGPRESIAFTLGTEFRVDKAERAREAL